MTNKCGQKRQLDYDAVLAYSTQHPTLTQDALAEHFGATQSAMSKVLRHAGIQRIRGRKPRRPEQVPNKWERILHDAGLSLDRGLRIGNDRIFYGQDYDRI